MNASGTPLEDAIPLDSAPLPDINMEQLMKGHVWRQHGNMLECQSCTYHHGMMLHGHDKLTHQEGGMPHIKRVVD